jgi:hypothetical protein
MFEEILLVNGKAAIALIEITNDKAEDLITDKLNFPSIFTKLDKWLMMSGGSWVFNKANSNIYTCFCLKSAVPVKDMATWVSFEFSCLGESKIQEAEPGYGNGNPNDAPLCQQWHQSPKRFR